MANTTNNNLTGSFYVGSSVTMFLTGSGNVGNGTGKRIGFDASRSSSIYKDSITTVQPSSITLIPQIRY